MGSTLMLSMSKRAREAARVAGASASAAVVAVAAAIAAPLAPGRSAARLTPMGLPDVALQLVLGWLDARSAAVLVLSTMRYKDRVRVAAEREARERVKALAGACESAQTVLDAVEMRAALVGRGAGSQLLHVLATQRFAPQLPSVRVLRGIRGSLPWLQQLRACELMRWEQSGMLNNMVLCGSGKQCPHEPPFDLDAAVAAGELGCPLAQLVCGMTELQGTRPQIGDSPGAAFARAVGWLALAAPASAPAAAALATTLAFPESQCTEPDPARMPPLDCRLLWQLLSTAAAAGAPTAMVNVGMIYYGQGSFPVPADALHVEELPRPDAALARAWWERAARLDQVEAHLNLGFIASRGEGQPDGRRNEVEAAQCWALAAAAGDARGQLLYAQCLLRGAGTPIDRAEAMRFLLSAAEDEHGHELARAEARALLFLFDADGPQGQPDPEPPHL